MIQNITTYTQNCKTPSPLERAGVRLSSQTLASVYIYIYGKQENNCLTENSFSHIANSFGGAENSLCEVANPFGGTENSLCGVANPFGGAANSFCGVANSLCGAENLFCGATNLFCGVANSFCGAANLFFLKSIFYKSKY